MKLRLESVTDLCARPSVAPTTERGRESLFRQNQVAGPPGVADITNVPIINRDKQKPWRGGYPNNPESLPIMPLGPPPCWSKDANWPSDPSPPM